MAGEEMQFQAPDFANIIATGGRIFVANMGQPRSSARELGMTQAGTLAIQIKSQEVKEVEVDQMIVPAKYIVTKANSGFKANLVEFNKENLKTAFAAETDANNNLIFGIGEIEPQAVWLELIENVDVGGVKKKLTFYWPAMMPVSTGEIALGLKNEQYIPIEFRAMGSIDGKFCQALYSDITP